jgi:DNA helicase HerA-like ATPase
MNTKEDLAALVNKAYSFEGDSFKIGRAMLNGQVVEGADVRLPLGTLNRHGLIAGATGTGKTKTLQLMAEGLSDSGVPVLMLDIKGDLSGIAMPGESGDKLIERSNLTGIELQPRGFPVELLSLGEKPGTKLRATVTEFGPVLLSKILGLNDTQAGLVAIIFKYCDDQKMPLLDLKDFVRVLQFISDEGKKEIEKEYGKISTASTGTILRKVIELQQQGGDHLFGEKSFEVDDLIRTNQQGLGMISILNVTGLQDRPKLFSTFMLQLLAELYAVCPEEGDVNKPKLVMFIDEAHLIFNEASDALLNQIETIVKLIRSKGIGVFFCTQNPMDIPAPVLSQLGLKVQHALRAFTAADRKTIKKTAENYPETDFYDVDELLTQLGIGEAFITMLNEKGIPTPLVHVMMAPPMSRMDVLTIQEIQDIVASSAIAAKYNAIIDSNSAYEILNQKLETAQEQAKEEEKPARERRTAKEPTVFDNPMVRQAGRTAASILTRSLLGVLGLGGSTRRRKRNSWF